MLGDWDGDGDDDLGDPPRRHLAHPQRRGTVGGATATTFGYGVQAGDQPVAGDWDGDGDDDAGIFRGGAVAPALDRRGRRRHRRRPSRSASAGDQPLVGDGTDPRQAGHRHLPPTTA